MPPADPPPHEIDSGRSLNARIRSASERNGDAAGTTSTSYSPSSRAIGVTSRSVSAERCVTIAPSMISPDIIATSPVPRSAVTKRARPIVPAAPGMFSTDEVWTMPGALQGLLHHTRGVIPAAARCGRRDQPQVLVDRLRSRGRGRRAEQNRKEHAQHGESRHDCIVCERFSFAPNRSAKAFALRLFARSAKPSRTDCRSPIWCSAKALAERPCPSRLLVNAQGCDSMRGPVTGRSI